MPKNIQKSLQDYLSKIKTPRSQIQLPSKKWINLKGCKHPRTHSFSLDDGNNNKNNTTNTNTTNNKKKKDDEATLADIDRFLFENFKSLYLGDDEETNDNISVSEDEEKAPKGPKLGPMLFDSSSNTLEEPPPLDLYGSNRFYVTRGFSGSMVDTPTTTTSTNTNTCDEAGSSSTSSTPTTINDNSSPKEGNGIDQVVVPDNCVVVLASSPSPYDDFRRSMEGMVEARLRNNQKVDWDFMQELLFCYINLNEKKSYKFILSAFVDLITIMRRRRSETVPVKPRSVRTVRIGREIRKKTKEVTLEFGSSR